MLNASSTSIRWQCARLHELRPFELQRIHMARQKVFVIEQCCAFQDADEADEHCAHLSAWSDRGELLAYARLVDPGVKYAEASMGRVLTTGNARGTGLGRELIRRAMALLRTSFPSSGVRISAQLRLQAFYGEVGFVPVGEPYLEDDMPHIEMLWQPAA